MISLCLERLAANSSTRGLPTFKAISAGKTRWVALLCGCSCCPVPMQGTMRATLFGSPVCRFDKHISRPFCSDFLVGERICLALSMHIYVAQKEPLCNILCNCLLKSIN